MHVISYQQLREFSKKQSDCYGLDAWFKIAIKANWSNLIEVQLVFPTVKMVGNFTVFSFKENKYYLILSLDYEGQLIYIKSVLAHADYDKEQWQHDASF